ncbi:arylsulfatase [Aeromicrobium piscarium]|uniref:Arylsulfatase n=1 Tax=Aeromicrobium piscarium TaxID=2590901 RepID=A0A554SQ24_9ACTN|nr:arylsulfatase [Aeromicrobium piscarium]TSD68461.1 arylsulfatase [Aeromicrobium piscarium]
MSYETYPAGSSYPGAVEPTVQESRPAWPAPRTAPDGAPNVVTIVLDDLGYAQIGCFGGLGGRIETPHLDRLAAEGLRFRNFHVTPLCSPTRAALLTGRNAHAVGVGSIMEYATGFPGYNTMIPDETAMTPAILREHGYSTMALGKWHLTPDAENGPWGPFDRWPLAKGFDRFYGFLPGETSQWAPELWRDHHRVEVPAGPEDGYHLSADLVDTACSWIDEQNAVTPDKPYYLYLAFGAMHAPHHAPREWIEKYRGCFDVGWDVIRRETLERQIELGVVPPDTRLADHNDGIRSWDSFSAQEQRVLCRQMETFAGFLAHTDHQIGRLVEMLRERGDLDDTVLAVVADNGASAEGGPHGLFHELSYFNRSPEDIEEMDRRLDEWGGPTSHPHYAAGWAEAGNTPNRWYKTTCHEGGTRVPLIVHWPAGITQPGAVREQYGHAIDLLPTLLDLADIQAPRTVAGVEQRPFDGASLRTAITEASGEPSRSVQHFECFGHRAVWRDGWKAVALHVSSTHAFRVGMDPALAHDGDYDRDVWELYRVDEDFSETRDLAAEEPELLRELVELWWSEAERNQVLPLDDRGSVRFNEPRPQATLPREVYSYSSRVMLGRSSSPDLRNRTFSVTAEIDWEPGQEGAVVSYGNFAGGFSLFVLEDRLHVAFAYLGRREFAAGDEVPLSPGRHVVGFSFERAADHVGVVRVFLDGEERVRLDQVRTNPILWSAGQGLQVGGDSISSVSRAYRSPFDFRGDVRSVRIGLDEQATVPGDDGRILAVQQ